MIEYKKEEIKDKRKTPPKPLYILRREAALRARKIAARYDFKPPYWIN